MFMRWARNVGRKTKVAILVGVVVIAALADNLWRRSDMEELGHSVSSIYEDRLVPATHVFKLTDRMYRKRLSWAEAERPGQAEAVRADLSAHDAAIQKVVTEFEATYLVTEERQALDAFKATWKAGRDLEQAFVARPSPEVRDGLTREFDRSLRQLSVLSQIQQEVGQDLKKGSTSLLHGARVLTEVEISLLIVLCLLIQILVVPNAGEPLAPRRSRPS